MITTILSALGIPALINVVKGALSLSSNPKAQVAVSALEDVIQAVSAQDITPEQVIEMNRHTEQMAQIEKEMSASALKAVNDTIRKEASSADGFIRRWRALFGYAVALLWSLTMLFIIIILFIDPYRAPETITIILDTLPLWMIALAILGVSNFSAAGLKKSLAKKLLHRHL